jgi:hypothetical protein
MQEGEKEREGRERERRMVLTGEMQNKLQRKGDLADCGGGVACGAGGGDGEGVVDALQLLGVDMLQRLAAAGWLSRRRRQHGCTSARGGSTERWSRGARESRDEEGSGGEAESDTGYFERYQICTALLSDPMASDYI